jgi:hypothetical protein
MPSLSEVDLKVISKGIDGLGEELSHNFESLMVQTLMLWEMALYHLKCFFKKLKQLSTPIGGLNIRVK